MITFLESETWLSSHLVCSDGLSHCPNGADYSFILPHATQWKGNTPTIVLRIVIFLLLVRDNRIQFIHFSQVISYLFSRENMCCLSETRLGQFTLVGSLRQWHLLIERYLLIDRNSDLSDMAELPSFSPPASESTIEYRTSPLRLARIRPKLKSPPVNIYSIAIISL